MKKVLFVIPATMIGGTSSVLQQILLHVRESFDVDVFIIYNNEYENLEIIKDHVISNKSKLLKWKRGNSIFSRVLNKIWNFVDDRDNQSFSKQVFKYNAKRYDDKYDVVVGFEENIATLFASYINAPKKIAWVHCDYERYYKLNNFKSELDVYNKFDRIVCVVNSARKNFEEIYPTLKSKTVTIYNPIDMDIVKNKSNEKINDLDMPNCYKICSVGRFDEVKQFDIIPEIASELVNKGLDFKWYIIGNNNTTNGSIVKKNIKVYGVEDRVILLGEKKNPYKYMNTCDLFVSTSKSETYSMVINEAILLGKYVIANEYPSLKEVLKDGDGEITNIDNMSNCILNNIDIGKKSFQIERYSKLNNIIIDQIKNLLNE